MSGMISEESSSFPSSGSSGGGAVRKKLILAPRSVGARSTPSAPSSSIFGGARSREEILKSKGLDVKDIERRIESKKEGSVLRLTRQQEEEVGEVRREIEEIKRKEREANENEVRKINKLFYYFIKIY